MMRRLGEVVEILEIISNGYENEKTVGEVVDMLEQHGYHLGEDRQSSTITVEEIYTKNPTKAYEAVKVLFKGDANDE